MVPTITQTEYTTFQTAYDFFNAKLFAGTLPNVMVTLQRHAKAYGYFHANKFQGRHDAKSAAHELALNPDHFGRTDELVLGTLAHEMAHVWQQVHGTAPRRAYHDKQWAGKMKEIGLTPSTTGAPGGKPTGQNCSHFITPGGKFIQAFAELQKTGFSLRWQSRPDGETRKKKAASKTKYTCPDCGLNAWAKPDTSLICGACYDDGDGDIVTLQAETKEDEES